jgi:hypothetical protein
VQGGGDGDGDAAVGRQHDDCRPLEVVPVGGDTPRKATTASPDFSLRFEMREKRDAAGVERDAAGAGRDYKKRGGQSRTKP